MFKAEKQEIQDLRHYIIQRFKDFDQLESFNEKINTKMNKLNA